MLKESTVNFPWYWREKQTWSLHLPWFRFLTFISLSLSPPLSLMGYFQFIILYNWHLSSISMASHFHLPCTGVESHFAYFLRVIWTSWSIETLTGQSHWERLICIFVCFMVPLAHGSHKSLLIGSGQGTSSLPIFSHHYHLYLAIVVLFSPGKTWLFPSFFLIS